MNTSPLQLKFISTRELSSLEQTVALAVLEPEGVGGCSEVDEFGCSVVYCRRDISARVKSTTTTLSS